VIPHFREFPLISSKARDVEIFDEVCQMMIEEHHLHKEGFQKLVKKAMEMNPGGKRKYREDEILISLRSDEGIVYATGNSG
jgi:hypothetical protein